MTDMLLDRAFRKRKRALYWRLIESERDLENSLAMLNDQLTELHQIYTDNAFPEAVQQVVDIQRQIVTLRTQTNVGLGDLVRAFNYLPEDRP